MLGPGGLTRHSSKCSEVGLQHTSGLPPLLCGVGAPEQGFISGGDLGSQFWLRGVWGNQRPLPSAPGLQEVYVVDLALCPSVWLAELVSDGADLADYLIQTLPPGQELGLL